MIIAAENLKTYDDCRRYSLASLRETLEALRPGTGMSGFKSHQHAAACLLSLTGGDLSTVPFGEAFARGELADEDFPRVRLHDLVDVLVVDPSVDDADAGEEVTAIVANSFPRAGTVRTSGGLPRRLLERLESVGGTDTIQALADALGATTREITDAAKYLRDASRCAYATEVSYDAALMAYTLWERLAPRPRGHVPSDPTRRRRRSRRGTSAKVEEFLRARGWTHGDILRERFMLTEQQLRNAIEVIRRSAPLLYDRRTRSYRIGEWTVPKHHEEA